jgi:hypothetical protein
MQNINTSEQLKAAIQLLEIEQYEKGMLLKAEAVKSFERLNPLNFLTDTLEDSKSFPIIIDKMIESVFRIFSGYISDKITGGDQSGPIRKIFGALIKSGLTRVLTSNSDIVKSISQYIYLNLFKKRE